MSWIAIVLLAASPLARADILPVDLEPKVGPNYLPDGPEEQEIWRSLERLEETIRTSPQRLIAPELDALMREIIERLIGRAAPELRIYLLRDAAPNAAMLPSGMMIVNTGLLVRVRSEAQLAAVLGHEAGHYFRRHSLDLHRDSRRKAAMATAAASALHTYSDSYGGWNQISQAIIMAAFRFSRDLESEADAYGLMLMARAGYPPRAASEVWGQLIEERRASAAARDKHFGDGTRSLLSTHPPTESRLINLVETADHLAGTSRTSGNDGRDNWAAAAGPYQALLLREQVHLNDPGACLYLLESLAKDGWTGLLRFNEGEVYRLRHAQGDETRAAAAYAAAVTLADAPPEAWRAHGYALHASGSEAEAFEALKRYLAMKPDAADAAMVRSMLAPAAVDAPEAVGNRVISPTGHGWKKLPASARQSRWEDVWTWSGPQLDRMTLVGGLPDGKAMIFRKKSADSQAPVFRAEMSALDLASMIEVSYRVNGVTAFDFESVEPRDFLGGPGIGLRYQYASGIGFAKRGICVMRVVDGKLFAMKLEGVSTHFAEVVPEFDRVVSGARLGR